MTKTNPELNKAAVEAVKIHGGQRAAARALGIGLSTLQQRTRAADKAALPEANTYKREIFRLTEQLTALRSELKNIHKDNLDAEKVRSDIFGLSGETIKPPAWLLPASTAPKSTGIPSTTWSDWHLGEVVELAETNGVNKFNLAIAETRIRRLVERTIDLCFKHMTNPTYPGIVVNLIGDIVSGNIHEELTETNEEELFPVILWAVARLSSALAILADRFGNVFVACAAGNHGRQTKKPQCKRYVYKNADWLIYNLLDRQFKDDPRISFSIPAANECLYRVYDHRYLALHGDDLGVKGGDGIIGAIGPIMRGEIKVANSSSHINRAYDTLLMGHWHQLLWLPRAIVNNTLKGYDEYARRVLRAPASLPGQALWFTHPKWGITAKWEVGLGEKKSIGRAATEWKSIIQVAA